MAFSLLHQQHLAGAFDSAIEPPLIMRRQPGIFPGQDAALIGHKLLQEGNILEIERINREINLGLRTWRAHFTVGSPIA